jgi:hypothetical protein
MALCLNFSRHFGARFPRPFLQSFRWIVAKYHLVSRSRVATLIFCLRHAARGRNRLNRGGFVLKDANRYPVGVVGRKAARACAAQEADAIVAVAQH